MRLIPSIVRYSSDFGKLVKKCDDLLMWLNIDIIKGQNKIVFFFFNSFLHFNNILI